MLVHAGKYNTEDKLKIQTLQKTKHPEKLQTTQNAAKQNYPGSVASYIRRSARKQLGWAYSTALPSPHGTSFIVIGTMQICYLLTYLLTPTVAIWVQL